MTILVAVGATVATVRVPTTPPVLAGRGQLLGLRRDHGGDRRSPARARAPTPPGAGRFGPPWARSSRWARSSPSPPSRPPGVSDGDEVVIGLLLVPGALAGFAASGPLRPVVDRGRLRPAILAPRDRGVLWRSWSASRSDARKVPRRGPSCPAAVRRPSDHRRGRHPAGESTGPSNPASTGSCSARTGAGRRR